MARPARVSGQEKAVPEPTIQWSKTLAMPGDQLVHSLRMTSDGGLMVTGSTGDLEGTTHGFAAKFDTEGALLWMTKLDGVGHESALAACDAADGHFIAGITAPAGARSDGLLTRLSGSGDVLWQRKFDTGGRDSFRAVVAVSEGGCLAAGSTDANSAGGSDFWLVQIDAEGEILWQRTYGGPEAEFAQHLAAVKRGQYIVAGTRITAEVNAGNSNVLLFRIDPAGEVVWRQEYGEAGDDAVASLAAMQRGGLAAAVNAASGSILHLSDGGAVQWRTELADVAMTSIAASRFGGLTAAGFIFQGEKEGHGCLAGLSVRGDIRWRMTLEAIGLERVHVVELASYVSCAAYALKDPRTQEYDIQLIRVNEPVTSWYGQWLEKTGN